MAERHTSQFRQFGVNLVSDVDRKTITLQFDASGGAVARLSVGRVVNALARRYGSGVRSRLSRWLAGQPQSLLLGSLEPRQPDDPIVVHLELGDEPGVTMDAALASLIDFLRRQPGYERTYGEPLDRDPPPSRPRTEAGDPASEAAEVLRRWRESRKQRRP